MLDCVLEATIKEDGGETTTETIEGVEVTVVAEGDNQDHMVGMFEKEQHNRRGDGSADCSAKITATLERQR